MDEDTLDARLTRLFVTPDPAPDPVFVARVERFVRAETLFAAKRKRAWRKFRSEAQASAAVTAAFGLLWNFAPQAAKVGAISPGPAVAAILTLGLWFLVELRPVAASH